MNPIALWAPWPPPLCCAAEASARGPQGHQGSALVAKLHQSLPKWLKSCWQGCATSPNLERRPGSHHLRLRHALHLQALPNWSDTPRRLTTGFPVRSIIQRLSCGQVMALQSIDLSAQGSRGQVVVLSMEFGQGGCFITASSQVNMAHWASTALPDPCSYKEGLEDISDGMSAVEPCCRIN